MTVPLLLVILILLILPFPAQEQDYEQEEQPNCIARTIPPARNRDAPIQDQDGSRTVAIRQFLPHTPRLDEQAFLHHDRD
ncbi:MAG: hypothetical protein HZA92_11225 [Verrucomicrobia bacterium]|nr:hypothetical protein [Verrucomicrobiota bacterium]